MRALPTLLFCCTLGLSAPAALAGDLPAQSAEKTAMTDKARQLFQEGVAAYNKGKLLEAHASFLAAWSLNPHWQIAANLADIELELHENREAAAHATYYRKHAPAERHESAEAQARRALALVGSLVVEVDTAGADVLIDDVAAGRAPLDEPVFVEPGQHRVTARVPGRPDVVRSVTVAAGEAQAVSLRGAVAVPEPPPPPLVEKRPLWPVIAAGSIAVVALGVGTGLTVAANGKSSSADALRSTVSSNSSCTGSVLASTPTCTALLSDLKSRDSLTKGAFAGFVIGGAFAATTAGLGAWAVRMPKTKKDARDLHVVPMLGRAEGAFVVLGSF